MTCATLEHESQKLKRNSLISLTNLILSKIMVAQHDIKTWNPLILFLFLFYKVLHNYKTLLSLFSVLLPDRMSPLVIIKRLVSVGKWMNTNIKTPVNGFHSAVDHSPWLYATVKQEELTKRRKDKKKVCGNYGNT